LKTYPKFDQIDFLLIFLISELTYHVKTKIIVANFTEGDLKTYNEIQNELTGMRIGILGVCLFPLYFDRFLGMNTF
jgi:hypothetical protein